MLVKAINNIAYKSEMIQGGTVFELDSQVYEQFKNDVVVLKEKDAKAPAMKTVTVIAKHNFAYAGDMKNGGDTFDMLESDVEQFQNDVEPMEQAVPTDEPTEPKTDGEGNDEEGNEDLDNTEPTEPKTDEPKKAKGKDGKGKK